MQAKDHRTPIALMRHRLLSSAALSCLASAALALSHAGPAIAQEWHPRVTLGGGYSTYGHTGDFSGAGELQVFVPVAQDSDSLLFLDGRAFHSEDERILGGGFTYRSTVSDGLIIGGGAHFEYTESEYGNQFGRVVVEGEALGETWDARVRGFIPTSDSAFVPELSEFGTDATGLIVFPGRETAPWGITGEAGYSVFTSDSIEGRAYAGGFYFDDDGFDELAGPSARLEIHVDDIFESIPGASLTGYVAARYDDSRDFESRAMLGISIPFGGPPVPSDPVRTRLQDRLGEQFVRDPFTTLVEVDRDQPLPALVNGQQVKAFYYNEGGLGDKSGSSPDNASDYDGAGSPLGSINLLPDNSIGVILDSGGDISTGGVNIGINPPGGRNNIIILGGGSSVPVSAGGLFDAVFTAPGGRPTVDGADPDVNNFQLTGAENAQVIGITFTGGDNGVFIQGSQDVRLSDLWVIDPAGAFTDPFGGDGVAINQSENVTITGLKFQDTINTGTSQGDGLDVRDSTNVMIENVSIDGADRSGILVGAGTSDFTLSNVTVTNSGGPTNGTIGIGIFNSDTGTLNNITIDDVNSNSGKGLQQGLLISGSSDITGSNIMVSDTGQDGIRIQSASERINLSNVMVTDADRRGIHVGGSSKDITINNFMVDGSLVGVYLQNAEDVTFSGGSVTNTFFHGFRVGGGSSSILLDNVTVGNVVRQGITVLQGASDITISNFAISNIGFNGILVTQASNDVTIDTGTITDVGLGFSPPGEVGGIHITGGSGAAGMPVTISNVTISQTVPDSTPDDGDDTNGVLIANPGSVVQIANTAVTGLFEAGFRILNPAGQEFAAGSTGNTTDVIPACSANLVGPGTGTIQINGVTYNTDCSVP